MKSKIVFALVALFASLQICSAQRSCQDELLAGDGCSTYLESPSAYKAPGAILSPYVSDFVYSPGSAADIQHKIKVGKTLLISAGAMTVAGAGLYCSAWYAMGDGGTFPAVLSISGVTLMGASLGMYVAGAIVYSSGRKAQRALSPQVSLAVTPTGVALRF